jgi:hypothetical protein
MPDPDMRQVLDGGQERAVAVIEPGRQTVGIR